MRLLIYCLFFSVMCFGQTQESPEKLNDSALSIYKKDPKGAISILEKSEEIAKSLNLDFELARAKNGLGIIYRDLGEFQKAINYAEAAMSISSDSLLRASSLNNIGRVNRQLGAYEDALKYYLESLDIYSALNEKVMEATVTNNIGLVYSYLDINPAISN